MEKLLIFGELADDTDLARLCEREGYRVEATDSRRVALDQIGTGGVSIVLLCQCVDDPQGLNLLNTIRSTDPRCEVVFVACNTHEVELPMGPNQDSAVHALSAGALDYLRQPISVRALRTALECARHSRGVAAAE